MDFSSGSSFLPPASRSTTIMCPSDKQQPNGSSPRRSTHTKTQASLDVNNSPLVSNEIRQQVATEAAQTGYWIRLIEHVVETVAATVNQKQCYGDDGYIIKSSIQSVPPTLPTSCHLIIQEAAAVGSMKHGRNTIIITTEKPNGDALIDDDDPILSSFQRQLWQNGENTSTSSAQKRIIQATDKDDAAHLVNQYVEYRRQVRSQQAVDFMVKAEESERYHQQQELYQTHQLVLPTAVVPRFQRQRPSYQTVSQIKAELVAAVVTEALDRQTRLVVDKQFLVRTACHCVYCSSGYPNPFQTQAYAKLRSRQGWSDDSMQDEEQEQQTPTTATKTPTHSKQPTSTTTTARRKTATTLDDALANSVHAPVNDPHLPSHFRTVTTAKHHQRAWKERTLHHQPPNNIQQRSSGSINDVAISPRRISSPSPVWASPQPKPRTGRKSLDAPLSCSAADTKTIRTERMIDLQAHYNIQQRSSESINDVANSPRRTSSPIPVWASPQPKPRTGRKTLDAPLSCSAADTKSIRTERMIDLQAHYNIQQRSREIIDDVANSPRRTSSPIPVRASPQPQPRTARKTLDAPLSSSVADRKTTYTRSLSFSSLPQEWLQGKNTQQRSSGSINDVVISPRRTSSPIPVWPSPQPKPRTGRKTLDAPLSCSAADTKTIRTERMIDLQTYYNIQQRSRGSSNDVPNSPRRISSPTSVWASPQPKPRTGRKNSDAPLSCSAAESKTAFTRSSSCSSLPQEWLEVKQRLTSPAIRNKSAATAAGLPPPPLSSPSSPSLR